MSIVNQSLWRQYLSASLDDPTVKNYADWLEREVESLQEANAKLTKNPIEVNTSVFTTNAVCALRDVAWDLIYRLEEWVGGVESKQDEKIIAKAKQALVKLVKP